MLAELRKVRYPLETGLLVALAFFLPLLEAPKNYAWLAYAAVWLPNRIRAREFGGSWDLWDTLIALWIASGYLVAALAGLEGSEWRGATDLLRYASILWLPRGGGGPGSGGAGGVGLALLVVLGAAWWPRWRAPLAASLGAVALVAAGALTIGAQGIRKHGGNDAARSV